MIKKNYLNYGFIERGSKYHRKALRQCKRNKERYGVGFDDSETWNLDATFARYILSKNYNVDKSILHALSTVGLPDLVGNLYAVCPLSNRDTFNTHYDNILNKLLKDINNLSDINKIDISNFIYPRLLRFADITNGYPFGWNNITKHDEWIDYVKITAEDIKNLDFKKFILNIEKFWW
jgi:hypothetical protein